MSMDLIQSILYGLFSGFTEFLPISSSAHQALLLRLSGQSQRDSVFDLFVHAALLLAVAEKRGGMKLSAFDAYINIIGGL